VAIGGGYTEFAGFPVVHQKTTVIHKAKTKEQKTVLLTGLTGVSYLWDLPPVNCLTRVSLGLGAAGQFLVRLELFC
jgi:hypothetical protein